MTNSLEHIVPFPVNAQRNAFFGALSSILLYRNGCTEDTPFFCGRHQRRCIRCGGCGDERFLHKHHLALYQYLITITGCAYFWIDKAIGDPFDKPYTADDFSETARDRLSLALRAAGYRCETADKRTEEAVLLDRIRQSVAEKRPALIKLSLGDLWAVVTGYDDGKKLPYLMKSRRAPRPEKEWYRKLTSLVFITDPCDSAIPLPEALDHMVRHLNTGSRDRLEQKIYQKLETEPDGNKLAKWLNQLNGLAIETRWHASECCRGTLAPMTDDARCKKRLLEAADLHLRFHDLAWKVWGLLGVSPETHYCVPPDLQPDAAARASLRALFRELFAIDRQVSQLLQWILKEARL